MARAYLTRLIDRQPPLAVYPSPPFLPSHLSDDGDSSEEEEEEADEPEAGRDIGRRVKVFWTTHRRWFCGHVSACEERDGEVRHHVVFDDGDEHWLVLHRGRERWEWLDG